MTILVKIRFMGFSIGLVHNFHGKKKNILRSEGGGGENIFVIIFFFFFCFGLHIQVL